jgi:DNA (cytosine-5)-methyltransferase 1
VDNNKPITFGSLFSGGGGLDLGLEQAGLKCTFQVENDKHCITLLKKHWPDVPKNEIRPCMGLVGGDPCPIRSTMGQVSGSSKPDLSGYFLAMATRVKPRWILRENVVAPDIVDFQAGLEMLGHYCVIIETNSAAFTGQNRIRQFVAAFDTRGCADRLKILVQKEIYKETHQKSIQNRTPAHSLDTGNRTCSFSQNYVYAGPWRGLRSLTHTERELLQGWPIGWTGGLPNKARERITGNGVTAPVAKWLGELIMKVLSNE